MSPIYFRVCAIILLVGTTTRGHDGASPDIIRVPDPERGRGALTLVLMPTSAAMRSELNLTDVQLDQLRKLQAAQRQQDKSIVKDWSDQKGNQDELDAEMKNKFRTANDLFFQRLAAILDATQFRRLRQVEFQQTTKFHALMPLTWESVMAELEISSEMQREFVAKVKRQSDALKELNAERQHKIPETIARLLTLEERQELQELLGEPLKDVAFHDHVGVNNNAGRGQGLNSLLMTAMSPIVARDLEVVDDQLEDLKQLSIENRRLERDLLSTRVRQQREATRRGKGDIGPPSKELQRLRESIEQRLAEILLPHQMKRLRQLDFQIRTTRDAALPILSKATAAALKLSPEKQQSLKDAYAREWEVAIKETDRLYYLELDKLIESLTIDQQKRYHLLVGKRFDRWFE